MKILLNLIQFNFNSFPHLFLFCRGQAFNFTEDNMAYFRFLLPSCNSLIPFSFKEKNGVGDHDEHYSLSLTLTKLSRKLGKIIL